MGCKKMARADGYSVLVTHFMVRKHTIYDGVFRQHTLMSFKNCPYYNNKISVHEAPRCPSPY